MSWVLELTLPSTVASWGNPLIVPLHSHAANSSPSSFTPAVFSKLLEEKTEPLILIAPGSVSRSWHLSSSAGPSLRLPDPSP